MNSPRNMHQGAVIVGGIHLISRSGNSFFITLWLIIGRDRFWYPCLHPPSRRFNNVVFLSPSLSPSTPISRFLLAIHFTCQCPSSLCWQTCQCPSGIFNNGLTLFIPHRPMDQNMRSGSGKREKVRWSQMPSLFISSFVPFLNGPRPFDRGAGRQRSMSFCFNNLSFCSLSYLCHSVEWTIWNNLSVIWEILCPLYYYPKKRTIQESHLVAIWTAVLPALASSYASVTGYPGETTGYVSWNELIRGGDASTSYRKGMDAAYSTIRALKLQGVLGQFELVQLVRGQPLVGLLPWLLPLMPLLPVLPSP